MNKPSATFFVHSDIPAHGIPGITHRTIASRARGGMRGAEVWLQELSVGCATPVHRHDCDEVVVVLRGRARITIEGETTDVAAGASVVIPPNLVHDIVSVGDEPLEILATLAMAPVRVETADGAPIPLPWGE